MPYICKDPDKYLRKKFGTGHCVPFVQEAAGAPVTSRWKPGIKVRGNDLAIARGTAIATFKNGSYANASTGNHAAIYISQDERGIQVLDQWVKQGMVLARTILFRGGSGSASNDGDMFSVIE